MLKKAAALAQWVVRITGPVQVLLGILFWTGHAFGLIRFHMLVGMGFTAALLVLAVLAAAAGLRWWVALLAFAWGVVVPAFGMMQTRLLPGPAHWTVRLLHLLIGLAAMVVAARLTRFIQRQPSARSSRGARAAQPLHG